MIVLFIFIIFRKLNQAVSTIIFGRTKAFIFFILWLGDCLVLDPEDVRDANYTISESPNKNWDLFPWRLFYFHFYSCPFHYSHWFP
jgi:hypothetical protein